MNAYPALPRVAQAGEKVQRRGAYFAFFWFRVSGFRLELETCNSKPRTRVWALFSSLLSDFPGLRDQRINPDHRQCSGDAH